jgi:hypothetical protein
MATSLRPSGVTSKRETRVVPRGALVKAMSAPERTAPVAGSTTAKLVRVVLPTLVNVPPR